jgi:hypothetical protein
VSEIGIRDWLLQLGASVRNPPSQHDFQARMSAVSMACHDIPARCWCRESLVEAVQTFQFWPSGADVFGLLSAFDARKWPRPDAAYVSPLDYRVDGPRSIGAMNLLGQERDRDAEMAHVRRQAEIVTAELLAQAAVRRTASAPIKASYLDKLTLARAATPAVLASRPDLRAVLAQTAASDGAAGV